jgi:hypothetical protein
MAVDGLSQTYNQGYEDAMYSAGLTPTPAPSPDDLVRAALEWAAEQINRSYGQPMHHLHKTVCAAATDPATVAEIVGRTGK